MGDPLTDLLLLAQSPSFVGVVEKELSECLVALHVCIQDDYQMKTINYKMLVLLKRKGLALQKCVFALIEKLVVELRERFLLLMGDLVPFLLEAAGSRQQAVASTVRRIIGQVEDISGETIQSYAQ